jgi:hypothetical protein
MQIVRVWMPQDITELWIDVENWIYKGLRHADGKYSIEDIFNDIVGGDKQLWVVYNKTEIVGCVVTEIIDYPQEKRLGLFLACGNRFDEWFHLRTDIYCWAKEIGCKVCEFYGRKGWVRKLSPYFKLEHVCMKEDIK